MAYADLFQATLVVQSQLAAGDITSTEVESDSDRRVETLRSPWRLPARMLRCSPDSRLRTRRQSTRRQSTQFSIDDTSSSRSLARRLPHCSHMTGRRGSITKNDVTLGTNELRIGLLLVQLVIQYPAFVRCRRYVTTLRTATRFHRHLRDIHGIHSHGDVALCARRFSV